jgi:hypothetical protein
VDFPAHFPLGHDAYDSGTKPETGNQKLAAEPIPKPQNSRKTTRS